MEEKKLVEINKQLKVDINEASFISMKCRNKLLKIFSEEFNVDLDISNYQNVDLKIQDDFSILYRDDIYHSKEPINNIKEVEDLFSNFQEKANHLIKKKEIDFQNKSNWNNITNLVMMICILLALVGIIILVIYSFVQGDFYNGLWLLVFIVPATIPKLKDSLLNRYSQAKNYLKSLLKKIK